MEDQPTSASKNESPRLLGLEAKRHLRVATPRARVSSPWASPPARPTSLGDEVAGLYNDVITRMALSLGAPMRPGEPAACDSA
eukprot:307175-Hanusia_phi.AAC.2